MNSFSSPCPAARLQLPRRLRRRQWRQRQLRTGRRSRPASSPAAASPRGQRAVRGVPRPTRPRPCPSPPRRTSSRSPSPPHPGLTRNMLTTSVTVCAARHQQLRDDRQHSGRHRLAGLADPRLGAAGQPATGGAAVRAAASTGECAVFGGGYTWGAVRSADVRMAGQLAASLPIQLIADPTVPTVPSDCAGSGLAMQTTDALRSNGILGVGLFAADCGSACAMPPCRAGITVATPAAPARRARSRSPSRSPIRSASFALDNNGVVIDLPAIADAGAPSRVGLADFRHRHPGR